MPSQSTWGSMQRFVAAFHRRRQAGDAAVSWRRDLAGLYAAAVLLLLAAAGTAAVYVLSGRAVPPPAVAVPPAQPPPAAVSETSIPAGEAAAPAQAVNAVSHSLPATPLSPLPGRVRLAFGWQLHPVYHDWRFHRGVDIEAHAGAAVRAVLPGQVSDVCTDDLTGLTVVIEGEQGKMLYGSLAQAAVHKGERVSRGQVVGTVGDFPGEPYPHLHFGWEGPAGYLDPVKFIPQLAP